MSETRDDKMYFGDGIYLATDDSGYLHITAENGIEATDRVLVEFDVWPQFKAVCERLIERRRHGR